MKRHSAFSVRTFCSRVLAGVDLKSVLSGNNTFLTSKPKIVHCFISSVSSVRTFILSCDSWFHAQKKSCRNCSRLAHRFRYSTGSASRSFCQNLSSKSCSVLHISPASHQARPFCACSVPKCCAQVCENEETGQCPFASPEPRCFYSELP